jgi:hypothetical protein
MNIVEPYITRVVPFKFRGIDFEFALSHGLFSSADVDKGTRFLLKVFSKILDDDIDAGLPLPCSVLDAGCGVGVIGICAAAAISNAAPANVASLTKNPANRSVPGATELCLRSQDRDDLARAFTEYNARKNKIPPPVLTVHTEPLLASPVDSGGKPSRYDMILTNIPAKAGQPVLEDFIRRSAMLLNDGGRVIMVAVNTLADFFRSLIQDSLAQNENDEQGTKLIREETGTEHTVFVYTRSASSPAKGICPLQSGENFLPDHPFYLRASGDYEFEDELIHIDAVYGASEFDQAGGAALTAAKLIKRLGSEKLIANNTTVLIHEPGQGFFPAWLIKSGITASITLSGRNILGLEAARHNTAQKSAVAQNDLLNRPSTNGAITIVPVPDIPSFIELEKQFAFIAAFPELIPGTNLHELWWEKITGLLESGGVVIVALPSSEAERFDRKKPGGFLRLGDIKRNGFRALGYSRE